MTKVVSPCTTPVLIISDSEAFRKGKRRAEILLPDLALLMKRDPRRLLLIKAAVILKDLLEARRGLEKIVFSFVGTFFARHLYFPGQNRRPLSTLEVILCFPASFPARHFWQQLKTQECLTCSTRKAEKKEKKHFPLRTWGKKQGLTPATFSSCRQQLAAK